MARRPSSQCHAPLHSATPLFTVPRPSSQYHAPLHSATPLFTVPELGPSAPRPPAPPQGAPGGSGRFGTPKGKGRATGRRATNSAARASRLQRLSPPIPPPFTTEVTAFFTADSSVPSILIPPPFGRTGRRAAERGAEFRGRGGDGARRTQILRRVCQPQRAGRAVARCAYGARPLQRTRTRTRV
jgi:hypothetical protein